MLAYEDVRLVSRNGRDHTRRFRDLAAAISKLSAGTLVLDGEVAILRPGTGGRSAGTVTVN
jgi:ATP-dependent DNA ligase